MHVISSQWQKDQTEKYNQTQSQNRLATFSKIVHHLSLYPAPYLEAALVIEASYLLLMKKYRDC
jgi:hypothetical protein